MTADAVEIVAADDARLSLYRGVSDPALLRAHNVFVAEGRLVVRRVLANPRYRVRSVLVNSAARQQLAHVLDALPADVGVFVADESGFAAVTGYNIHRGCLALVERPDSLPLDSLLADDGTLIVLEGITDADNVGSAFRNAAAFGAAGVVLSPSCCDPFYRKAVRTSMAAVLDVPFSQAADWPAALDVIRANRFSVVALTPGEPSEPLAEFVKRPRSSRLALLAGTEGAGLSAEALAMADHRVRIPMSGGVDSLNVATALAVALYTLR
ncbi:MAG TPA: RNA methyltransferase [Vicinamibacterales bacterium]|jgi:tRNA G18 (ribose-2'-O)-methylase SpoU